jgi:hypothetical protein
MKSNSCSRTTTARLWIVAIVLGTLVWPTTGHGQGSNRRDRFRRDNSSRYSSSRADQGSRQASVQKAPAPRPTGPAPAAKPAVTAAQPAGANEAAGPRPDEVAPPTEGLEEEPSSPLAGYGIIFQRNIFSRQRTPFRPRQRAETQLVVPPNPETHFVLRGIVQENNEVIAFIEDTQGGGVLQLRRGDHVARGAIKTLSLDALEYQLEDKTISIRLGYDLEGTRAPAAMTADEVSIMPQTTAPAATAAPAGQQTPTQTSAPAGNEADILRRLMEQRRQQLGQ